MNENDYSKFCELMIMVGEMIHDNLSDIALKGYWTLLKTYPLKQVQEAAMNILKYRKYTKFPTVAEFIEYISPPEDLEARAAIACKKALDVVYEKADGETVYFEDPVIHLVIDHLEGWIVFCNHIPDDDKEFIFWKREFERLYRIYARRPLPLQIPRLIGRYELNNTSRGYLTDATGQVIKGEDGKFIMIGSPEAQKLLDTGKVKQLTVDAGDRKP